MKALMVFLLLLFLPGCAQGTPNFKRIDEVSYYFDTGLWHCTATAVAPHTLLVASHCALDTTVSIDVDDRVAVIKKQIHDTGDSTFLVVDITFKTWAGMRRSPLQMGETVVILGNPGPLHGILRLGYYAGVDTVDLPLPDSEETLRTQVAFFGYMTAGGDSGSAIFDAKGRVVGVNSGSYRLEGLSMAWARPFTFTKDQIREAGVYIR
jgi:V8-like Glu-specific endopeptidase